MTDEINLICPPHAAGGTISVAGWQFEPWHHYAAGRSYCLVRVPLELLPHFIGRPGRSVTRMGFEVAPDELQDLRAP